MTRLRLVSSAFGLVALLAALSGCATAPSESRQSTPEVAIPFKPEVSINQVMVSVIDHNSHILWDAVDEAHAPKTERDWHELEHAAVTLVASGSMLMLGGTGATDNDWSKQAEWTKFTQDQTHAASEAGKAIGNKDLKGLSRAGDNLVAACESCHAKYKPEVVRIKAQHH